MLVSMRRRSEMMQQTIRLPQFLQRDPGVRRSDVEDVSQNGDAFRLWDLGGHGGPPIQ